MGIQSSINVLIEGNKRFTSQQQQKRDIFREIKESAEGVRPYAAIVSCMDARVTPENIFDTKIGEIFSLRVGGNVVGSDILDSLEIAVNISDITIILVLGHTKCGAIMNASNNMHSDNVSGLITKVKPAIVATLKEYEKVTIVKELLIEKSEEKNVFLSIDAIRTNAIISTLESSGKLAVVGAMYDVATGDVSILNE
ncbi:MAG: carbonic anhydrase [Chloroflexi bacterium]|jgi:carbonic anhydrase|nr:MAG: carbonic anhydrase [Chloroflexota bacterium]|tara:strand:+ start:2174 stop:2764 length:591 start_codon:yes stop_codon:yes gene_type:complete